MQKISFVQMLIKEHLEKQIQSMIKTTTLVPVSLKQLVTMAMVFCVTDSEIYVKFHNNHEKQLIKSDLQLVSKCSENRKFSKKVALQI